MYYTYFIELLLIFLELCKKETLQSLSKLKWLWKHNSRRWVETSNFNQLKFLLIQKCEHSLWHLNKPRGFWCNSQNNQDPDHSSLACAESWKAQFTWEQQSRDINAGMKQMFKLSGKEVK